VAKKFRLAYTAAAVIPLSVLAAACGSNGNSPSSSGSSTPAASSAKMVGAALPSAPNSAAASVTETGSTLLYPLVSAWAADYQKQFTKVTITTGATGSGTGITDASTGTVNIGASDAYLSASERAANPTLLNIPLAISAQQVNYNVPGLKTGLKLNGKILAQIYSGKITKWNDSQIAALNPGVSLPGTTIVPLRRVDSSGDTFLFTSYLNAQDPSVWTSSDVGTSVSWPSVSGELAEQGNGGMVTGCSTTKGCIAYIGVSYETQTNADHLGQALLQNAAGNFVAPTASTIVAAASGMTSKTPPDETLSMINSPGAQSYPIINYEYAIVNTKQSDGVTAEDIRAFLVWDLTTGQSASKYLDAVNFQPLPAAVVTLSENQIKKIGA
jgi:phosphate transport system substrate-binding protein